MTVAPSEQAAIQRDFEFISTADHLNRWIEETLLHLDATGEKRVCLDTEADSLHHYHEKLCLLQVACGGRFALIDPLAIADITPIFKLLDRYELWFHGADYDLTMLRRSYNWEPRMIRDTQIAARLAGSRQFGLAALLQSVLGITICKAPQKADWSRRPLPEHMLSYAVDDVRYLLQVADHFLNILRDRNRMSWFEQSCRALQTDVAERSKVPREDPWRVQGSGRLNSKGLAILKSMWEWREGIAQDRDIPCYRIMSNKQMVAYAELFELGGVMQPPGGWRPRWKKEFHDLVAAVFRLGLDNWPQRLKKAKTRMSESQREAVDRLCSRRDEIAHSLDVEGSLLGSRSELELLVVAPASASPLMQWQDEIIRPILAETSAPAINSSLG
jgi:ribonuclease D